MKLSAPLLVSLAAFSQAVTALVAFPGAEGFGANAIGGRKGQVYVVTNLNDSGTGSLRDAVSATDRIVVFAVGGVIKISERMVISKRVTILGQTAPGDGITVYGNGWSFSNADDAIVRYIRIRMGKGGSSGKDAMGIADGNRMIFDHVSVSWGRDETFSINGDASNITIQNSIIAQGLETHSCGGLIQTDGGVSLFRNLYIDNKTRNPKVKGVNEFTNNVVYNWGGGGGYIAGDSDGQSYANIIGNYFISGPSTSVTAFTRGNSNFHGYVDNNFYDPDKDGQLDGSELGVSSSNYGGMAIVSSKYNYPAVAYAMTPAEAVTYVTKYAGASKVRDRVDTQLIAQVQSWGTNGALISDEATMGGPGTLNGGTPAKDTDGDGIPDEAEKHLGTNPNIDDSMKLHSSGYTYLEADRLIGRMPLEDINRNLNYRWAICTGDSNDVPLPSPAFPHLQWRSRTLPCDDRLRRAEHTPPTRSRNHHLRQQPDRAAKRPKQSGKGLFYTLYGADHPAGAMMAWAWATSLIIDRLEATPAARINTARIGVTGCSRNGKGTLVAGAFDSRIALTVPQESGTGGSGCWRLAAASEGAPQDVQTAGEIVQENVWFSTAFNTYANDVDRPPFDHHMLAGLIAPRGLVSIDNAGYQWLGPWSSLGCMGTARLIWQAMGVPDRMGSGGDLFAFINRFMLGMEVNTTVQKNYAGIAFDSKPWVNWQVPTLT
ncbi:hypothetical protein N7497_001195 [Penicillium chrysogenum]|nr:hypothetical protein N7497_001195 [Penicillium chrysogenum]